MAVSDMDRRTFASICVSGAAALQMARPLQAQSPAEIPLAAVVLSWDREQGRLFAEGVLGPDSFDQFFREVRGKTRAPVEGRVPVMRLRDYSAAVARC